MPFHDIDIWSEPSAADYVRSVGGGNETVPTVRVGDRALVNPSVREVLRAVESVDPELARQATPPRQSPQLGILVLVLLVCGVLVALVLGWR